MFPPLHHRSTPRAPKTSTHRSLPARRCQRASAPTLELLEGRGLLAAGTLQFSAGTYAVSDAAGSVPITITRTGGTTGSVSVSFATTDGSAASGTDYTPLTGALVFPDGVTTKSVTLNVLPEPIAFLPGRTVNMTLSKPTGGATLGAATSAVLTITHAAAPGDLNGAFGTNGRVNVPIYPNVLPPNSPTVFAADGSIYSNSNNGPTGLAVQKFNPDGTLDSTFGTNGVVNVALPANESGLTNATFVLQPDGKFFVSGTATGGTATYHYAVIRLNSDGTPDPTFGNNGFADVPAPDDPPYGASFGGAATLSNGEVIVVSSSSSPSNRQLYFEKLTPEGVQDIGFGRGGIVTNTVGSPNNGVSNILAMPDGTFVVGNSTGNFSGGSLQAGLWRYKSDGSSDTSFGHGGFVLGPQGYYGGHLAQAPNGDILQLGAAGTAGGVIAAYRPNGTVDTAFGAGTGSTAFDMYPSALAFEPDGKIVISGGTNNQGGQNGTSVFALVRLNTDGTLDATFAQGGLETTPPFEPGESDYANGVEVLPGGDILTFGQSNGTVSNIVFNRYVGVLPLVKSTAVDFDGDGKTDPTVFRQSSDLWVVNLSSGGKVYKNFGDPKQGDIPVPADYDGDGKTDFAVFRPSTDQWIIQPSSGGPAQVRQFGDTKQGDLPIPGNYEGNGKADLALFRPSQELWIVRYADGSTHTFQFGDPAHHDLPVPGDYEGVGKADLALFRPDSGQWIVRTASGGTTISQFGDPVHGDIAVPGDYDGDGKVDLAIFRPGTALFVVQYSSGTAKSYTQLGDPSQNDLPDAAPLASLHLVTPRVFIAGPPAPGARTAPAVALAPWVASTGPSPSPFPAAVSTRKARTSAVRML